MGDDPEDTDLDLLRDNLIMQAECGEITATQAEAAAAAHSLKPFAREPELPQFDPKLQSHWSIVMAVAWIAWRDFKLVREQDPGFCSETTDWHYRKWYDREHKAERRGYVLEVRSPPTVGHLARIDGTARIHGNVPSTAVMMVREAQAELWRALSADRLRATRLNHEGAVVEILPREWAYLRLYEEGGPDVRRDVLRLINGIEFTAVKLQQTDLLKLWPAASTEPSALPATVIDKGGRPAEYDWSAMKEFTLEIIKTHGRPHRTNKRLPTKAQLIEIIITTWAERFDLHPSRTQLRLRLSRWLTELGGN